MNKYRKKFTRRSFLKSSAGTFYLPLLPSLGGISRQVLAQEQEAEIKRVVFFYFPYDSYQDVVFPDPSLPLLQGGAGGVPYLNLTAENLPEGLRVPELAPHCRKMLSLRGIDMLGGGGHSAYSFICGRAPNKAAGASHPHAASIDSIIAKHCYASEPPFRSIHLGGKGNFHISFDYDNGNVHENTPIHSPGIAYDRFLSKTLPAEDPQLIQSMRRRSQSVMDVAKEEFTQLLKSEKLSAGDRNKLENHFQLIRELEVKIRNRPIPVCAVRDKTELSQFTNEAERNDRLVDILFEAIRCDMSRVFTMCQFAGSGRAFHGFDTHGLSHANRIASRTNQVAATQAIAKQIGRFLTMMDSAVEDSEKGRTYLDNTLVVWISNMGTNTNHQWLQKFSVIFGGTGAINQGKLLDFRGTELARNGDLQEGRPGRPANELLITLMQAMGLSPEHWEVNGEQGFGTYQYTKYWSEHYGRYNFGAKRQPLPGFFV